MLKFLRGEKGLAEALGLAIFLVSLSFVSILLLKELDVFASFSSLLIATFLISIPIRLIAWISVLRSLKNSKSELFKALAAILVVIDISHKLFYWTVVAFSSVERSNVIDAQTAKVEQCKAAISERFNQSVDNLHGEPKLDYGSGEPAYKIYTRSRTNTYRCYFANESIVLNEEVYVKWWRHSKKLDTAGAFLQAEVMLTPKYLALAYGAPDSGDGLRVSGEYAFVSDAGEVFTVHDYKSTTIWDADTNLPTPEAFWSSDEPVELSIGGYEGSDVEAFVAWLEKQDAHWAGLRDRNSSR